MKKCLKLISIIILTVSFFAINNNLSYAKKNADYINEVIAISDGNIEECGIKNSVLITDHSSVKLATELEEKICLQLLEEFKNHIGNNCVVSIQKSDFNYCINFENKDAEGYIESKISDNHKLIITKLIKRSEKNELTYMKSYINNVTKKVLSSNNIKFSSSEVKQVSYVKAKLSDVKFYDINNKIIKYLKKENVKNINTVNIDNGVSTVAYTENYEAIVSGNQWIDFNYMINKYGSNNYLVIGTPIIDVEFEQ